MESNHVKREFYYTDKLYKQYFRSEKSRNEQEKGQLLRKRLLEILRKIYSINREQVSDYVTFWCEIGYADNYGYYLLCDSDRGHYSVINGLPTEELDSAVLTIMEFILSSDSHYDELSNREEYKKDFIHRFGKYDFLTYSQCLYFAEYSLKMWGNYYENKIPPAVISHYESYMNDVENVKEHSLVWKYDCHAKAFVLSTSDAFFGNT